MAQGPGEYDSESVRVLLHTDAQAVVLLVVGGRRGSGVSVNAVNPAALDRLPTMLRSVADQIERDRAALPRPD